MQLHAKFTYEFPSNQDNIEIWQIIEFSCPEKVIKGKNFFPATDL